MPRDRWILPLRRDVTQRQPNQLGRRFVTREATFVADALSDLAVQTLNGVGGVEHLAHLWGESEERNHLLPVSKPALSDGGEQLTPFALLKLTQGLLCGLDVVGLVEEV